MSFKLTLLFLLAGFSLQAEPRISSRMIEAEADERVLLQEASFDVPVSKLWKAYTTSEGYMAWAAPQAEIELRVGGTVRVHYAEGAKVGDEGTNTLHILNYVPERILTLKAELSDQWPESLREDAANFSNVILFEAVGEAKSRVQSYGIGYRDKPEHEALLKFFMPANEGLLLGLQNYLEKGERTNFHE